MSVSKFANIAAQMLTAAEFAKDGLYSDPIVEMSTKQWVPREYNNLPEFEVNGVKIHARSLKEAQKRYNKWRTKS